MQAGQPPGGRGFFVAALPVQKIEIFVDILFCYAAPEGRIQPLGVDLLKFCICGHKPATALHKAAEGAQVTVITERRIGTFAGNHFKITHIFYNIRGSILKGCVLAGVSFVQIDRHSFLVSSQAVVFQRIDGICDIRRTDQLHAGIICGIQVCKAVFRDNRPLKADALCLV